MVPRLRPLVDQCSHLDGTVSPAAMSDVRAALPVSGRAVTCASSSCRGLRSRIGADQRRHRSMSSPRSHWPSALCGRSWPRRH